MREWWGWVWAGLALVLYVAGGLLVMAGLVLIGIFGTEDLWGLGEARGLGYLAFGVGVILSISGVLLVRVLRNRAAV